MIKSYLLPATVICFLGVSITPLTLSLVYDSELISPVHFHYATNVFDVYLIGCAVLLGIILLWEDVIERFHWTTSVATGIVIGAILTVKVILCLSEEHGRLIEAVLAVIVILCELPLIVLSFLHYTASHQTSEYSRLKVKRTSSKDRLLASSDNDTSAVDVESAHASTKEEEAEHEHATFQRLVQWAYPEWVSLSFGIVMLILASACTMAQPLYFGKIIGEVSQAHPSRDKLKAYVYLLVVIFAIGGITTSLRGWTFTLVGERIVKRVRQELFNVIISQDIAFFDKNKTGELMNRLSSDTAVVQSCLSVNISMGLRAAGSVTVSLILLFVTSWELTLVMIGVIPALVCVAIFYGRMTKKLTKEYQDALARAADVGSESISNIRIMKSFGGEFLEMDNYSKQIETSYTKGAIKARAYGIFVGSIMFLANIAILVVIYFGAILVIKSELNVSSLTSFVLYTIYIAMGLAEISSLFTEFMNALGASERIFRIIDTVPTMPLSGGSWPYSLDSDKDSLTPELKGVQSDEPVPQGRVVFDSVRFTYPMRSDVEVLKGFNLAVEPNQTVALVGASGSGKSTTLCLLERFYDLQAGTGGSVTIDGYNVKDLDPRWLHRAIAIVPQEPVLFSGSIKSNIMYSRLAAGLPPASMEEVEWAGRQANAHNFIISFPEGYDTVVGERGVRLSGGQKQRVAIARALMANPKILLLDEATSALDSESEQLVQEAIEKLMQNRTVIVIAHRLSTVRDANKIVVMENGNSIAAGTHDELMKSCPTYLNLVRKQLQWGTERDQES